MAVRTNEGEVKKVLMRDYDSQNCPTLLPFIRTASVVTDRIETCAAAKDITLTSTELELIERWLAAHFYSCSDRPFLEKTTGRSKAVFQGKTSMNLDSSHYGQTAKLIDTSGCLEALDKRKKVRVSWLGKPPSEQTDYVDRD